MQPRFETAQSHKPSRGERPMLVQHQVLRGKVATPRRPEQECLMLVERGHSAAVES